MKIRKGSLKSSIGGIKGSQWETLGWANGLAREGDRSSTTEVKYG